MDTVRSLKDALEDALPSGLPSRYHHLSTPPIPSAALFSAAPGTREQTTFCESHFLGIVLPTSKTLPDELLVYAIEVLIFTTNSLTTIFISKADSSGYLHLLRVPAGTPSLVRTITTSFLQFLVRVRLPGPRLVLSLFARSQNQYIFPGSVENDGKHVLDDRQLIKWWCRTINPIIGQTQIFKDETQGPLRGSIKTFAYLVVPGCDKFETKTFLPPDSKSGPPQSPQWQCSYPVNLLVEGTCGPPRCLIPRLPDDPKSRFLDDLDNEIQQDSGQWRSVRTLEQFWEMMSYRQECSAGRLVGFIWAIFTNRFDEEPSRPLDGSGQKSAFEVVQPQIQNGRPSIPTVGRSQLESETRGPLGTPTSTEDLQFPHQPVLPSSSSPVLLPISNSGATSAKVVNLPEQQNFYDSMKKEPVRWPESGRGQMVIDSKEYQELFDDLLQSDFSNQSIAVKSTSSWTEKVAKMAAGKCSGVNILGRATPVPVTSAVATDNAKSVNILTGVKRKRKAHETCANEGRPARVIPTDAVHDDVVQKEIRVSD